MHYIATAFQQPLAQMITNEAVYAKNEHVLFALLFHYHFSLAVELHAGCQIGFYGKLPAAYVHSVFGLTELYLHCSVGTGNRQGICGECRARSSIP